MEKLRIIACDCFDILESIADALYVTDSDGNIVFLNHGAEKLLGCEKTDLLGQSIFNLDVPFAEKGAFSIVQKIHKEKIPAHFEMQISKNEYFEYDVRLYKQGVVVCFRDITYRKKAEDELYYRHEFENLIISNLLKLINLNPDDIDTALHEALKDVGEFAGADTCFIYTFFEKENYVQLTHEWHASAHCSQLELPAVLECSKYSWALKKILQRENVYIPSVYSLPPHAVEEKIYMEKTKLKSLVIVPVANAKRVVGFVGISSFSNELRWSAEFISLLRLIGEIFANVLRRKETEVMLKNTLKRFEKAFHASPVMMAIISLRTANFIDVNETFQIISGYQKDELLGNGALFFNFLKEKDVVKLLKMIKKEKRIRNLELSIQTKTGETRIGLASMERIDVDGEPAVLTAIQDITDIRKLEKEFHRLDQLNLVGEMAAGFAHEIRNPMTTVRGFLQLLSGANSSRQQNEYFQLMIEELDRANAIITEYLLLAKNKVINLKPANINSIITSIYSLLASDAILRDQEIIIDLQEVPDLLLDEKEIRQLILNLARNGIEAMEPGGKLTLRTFMDSRNCVVLAVQDEGPGIPEEIQDKIGNPFFTTKDKGTGLGLAICYSIANRHNAKMRFRTSKKGTTFFVRFAQKSAERKGKA